MSQSNGQQSAMKGQTMVIRSAIANDGDGKRCCGRIRALHLFPKEIDKHVSACIQEVFARLKNVELSRWDQLPSTNDVMRDLQNRISISDVVVLVLGTRKESANRNTVYELGLAHGLGRNVISIVNEAHADYLPYDITHHRHVLYGNILDPDERKAFQKRLTECFQCLGARIDPIVEKKMPGRTEQRTKQKTPLHILNEEFHKAYVRLKPGKRLAMEIKQKWMHIKAEGERPCKETESQTERLEQVQRMASDLVCRVEAVADMGIDPLFCAYVLLTSCLAASLPILLLASRFVETRPGTTIVSTWQARFNVVLLLGVSLAGVRTLLMRKPTKLRVVASVFVIISVSFVSALAYTIVSQSDWHSALSLGNLLTGTVLVSIVASGLLCCTRSNSLVYTRIIRRATLGAMMIASIFLVLQYVLQVVLNDETPLSVQELVARALLALILSFGVTFLVGAPWLLTRKFWCATTNQ